jgi:hypothetical protein
LPPVTAVETVHESAKASTSADVVQALIEFALQSDMESNLAVQQKRVAARQMRDPFVRPKAARLVIPAMLETVFTLAGNGGSISRALPHPM